MQDDFIYTKCLKKQICRDEKQINVCPGQRVGGALPANRHEETFGAGEHSETAIWLWLPPIANL